MASSVEVSRQNAPQSERPPGQPIAGTSTGGVGLSMGGVGLSVGVGLSAGGVGLSMGGVGLSVGVGLSIATGVSDVLPSGSVKPPPPDPPLAEHAIALRMSPSASVLSIFMIPLLGKV